MASRVFVFGLDAAAPQLIARWAGSLPNLQRLIYEGVSGKLHSTIPPFTSPAWACMATGKNPGKVGIFGLRHRRPGSYKFEPTTSNLRRTPAVWDLVGAAGLPVIVMNVPDTYPPQPVNGIMISGRPAPQHGDAPISYPTEVRYELNRAANGYLLGPHADFDDDSRADELRTWEDVLLKQQCALEYLLDNKAWALCFYVSLAVDGISHHFWQHLDENHPNFDPRVSAKLGDSIRQIYVAEDERIGRVLGRMGSDDLLLVVSDHGSTPCHHHVSVNRWLIDHGYISLSKESGVAGEGWGGRFSQVLFNLYRRYDIVRRIAAPLRRTAIRDRVVHARFARKSGGRLPLDALPIDWSHTTAYYLGDDRVYLNVAGREPLGIVQPGAEYERVQNELRAALLAATIPGGDRSLFAAVHTREELYQGPAMEEGPDLVLVPGDPHWNLGAAVGQAIFDRPVVGGKHHPDGFFVAWGRDVRVGYNTDADILDIAPTLLHALGVAVPVDCDGQVRLDWFQDDTDTTRRPITYQSVSEQPQLPHEWQEDEMVVVESRLRDLGYLD